jgi:8-oxo-dGTP diphosphatase
VVNKDVVLLEHISLKWLTCEMLNQLDWAAADIPIVNKLSNNG